MQSYIYFPGCSLKTAAKDFDMSTKACAGALGIELKEMDEALCCGAVFSNVSDNLMLHSGPNRILARAQAQGNALVTLCAGCYNVLKRTNLQAKRNSTTQDKINTFNEERYTGGIDVLHFLEILRDKVGFDTIQGSVKKPLLGLQVGAYYGCLLLRPFDEMKFDDPHRPTVLEDLLTTLGCSAIDYPMRTECCGSYLSVTSTKTATLLSQTITQSAQLHGAKMLAVSCPLCKYNLEELQNRSDVTESERLPIVYFTQLLGLALGLSPEDLGLELKQFQTIQDNVKTVEGDAIQQ